ncbi:glutathione S-transferase N-terminal domain-containing protein [Aquibium sp. A9E412]|uniref:glutathione S-transferase family protein n=1 Tax=Aquibium sp. A9E412 TaxID=2976767 RepID=UPI0025B0B7FB|nr:glutathione S-transferase N-terminal domain-containing protein [Aquibium sp. A9E412]MDN2565313.1 glutathione S-transferase N-terminal domain-containing protein [Aquibium sp. A9E412]
MTASASALADFPIVRRWPASDPGRLQLYSFPTPNGVKVSAALEELGLPYEAHTVSLADGEQKTPEFRSLNPNGKIPAIVDPDGPDGRPLGLFESGAILVYLAEKTGRLMPANAAARYVCLQWVFFQMGGVGPMFGQFGHFFRGDGQAVDDPRPVGRYRDETRRLLGVLDARLAEREWLVEDGYTIADIATFPWVRTLGAYFEAGETLGLDGFAHVGRWLEACMARPASQAALDIPPRG